MLTFCYLAHMVDATQLCFFFPYHMVLKHKDREHSTMHPSVSQYVSCQCGAGVVAWTAQIRKGSWKNSKRCCDKKKTPHCAVTSSRSENMSDSISFRFRENPKGSSFA